MSVSTVTNGRPGNTLRETLVQRPVEMRHEGNHHVRLGFPPMRFEHAHRCAMPQSNHELQHLHQLSAAQRPAAAQHPVVEVLDPYAGVFLEDIQRVEQFLQIDQANFPRTFLRLNGHLQGRGCRAMAAAGVEETKLDPSACGRCILAFAMPQICYGIVKMTVTVSNTS